MLVLAGAALAIPISVLLVREPEPTYHGKSLSQWIVVHRSETYLSFRGLPVRGESVDAIRHIGTNALPWLVMWMRDDSPGSSFKSLVKKLPAAITPVLVRSWANDDLNAKRAMSAAFAFALLGDDARLAIPELTAVMTNSAATNASQCAVIALAGIGKAAIPALTTQLANTNDPNRHVVAFVFARDSLATNASHATSAVPLLVRCLDDPNPAISRAAFVSLGQMAKYDRSQAPMVVPALTNCLSRNAQLNTRVWATVVLGHYGTLASNATPSLLASMGDPNHQVRVASTNALLQIAPWEVTNFPTLVPINSYFPSGAPSQRGDRP